MKTINFYDIPEHIPSLEFDEDHLDMKLLFSTNCYIWSTETELEYNKAKEEIKKISFKGNKWEIYCSYDVFGFDYIIRQQKESNYIIVTISFETENIERSEIENIDNALEEIYSKCRYIQNKYHYFDYSNF